MFAVKRHVLWPRREVRKESIALHYGEKGMCNITRRKRDRKTENLNLDTRFIKRRPIEGFEGHSALLGYGAEVAYMLGQPRASLVHKACSGKLEG
jgi:hypothetical protein